MRNFVALSQEIVRKLSQREQLVFIDFVSRAFVAAQRNGVDYLRTVEFPLLEAVAGTEDERVRRSALELPRLLPTAEEVEAASAAKVEHTAAAQATTAEIAAGIKEGTIGTTPNSQPVHVHNEVSGIAPLDNDALADAADRALAKVQSSVARDEEILPAIGAVKAADAAADTAPATADAPVPVIEAAPALTEAETEIVEEVKETHGEAAAADAAAEITEAKEDAKEEEEASAEDEIEEEEEPAPVGANSNPVPVVPDTTTSAKPAAKTATKPAAKTAKKK